MASAPDIIDDIINASSLISWNDLKLKTQNFLENASLKKEISFISLGESHLYSSLNYELYEQLALSQSHYFKNFPFKICSETIGSVKEASFFQELVSVAGVTSYYGQSPQKTNFNKCYEEQFQHYFIYSGFHHQIPLAKIYPRSFQKTAVSSTEKESIYGQLKSKNTFSLSWVDFSYVESENLNAGLKILPQKSFRYFKKFLAKTQKKLNIAANSLLPLDLKNQSVHYMILHKNSTKHLLREKVFPKNHHLFIVAPSHKVEHAGLMTKSLLQQLTRSELKSIYKVGKKKGIIAHIIMTLSNEDKESLELTRHLGQCSLTGLQRRIDCESQFLYVINKQSKKDSFILLLEPNFNQRLVCVKNDQELSPSECLK